MKRYLTKMGPGLLVTAAFIGPGTVTTASKAGAATGLFLLPAVLFSVLAAIVLQEMAARLGIVSRKSLGEVAMKLTESRALRLLTALIILAAITYGNAAFQSGNLAGAAAGAGILVPAESVAGIPLHSILVAIMMLIAGSVLAIGRYQIIERVLIVMVVGMSLAFVITACAARPDQMLSDTRFAAPKFSASQLPIVLGLIGTTVVPYNLFLHSRSVQERWQESSRQSLREAQWDSGLAIGIGGFVTAAIVITSARTFYDVNEPGEFQMSALASQLEPTLGRSAQFLFGLGLFAAGITSSITAPLAAAYATCGVLGWTNNPQSWRFRLIWMIVLLLGGIAAIAFNKQPQQVILAAQVANALILPLIATVLLWALNSRQVMGSHRNRRWANIAGGFVIAVVSAIAIAKFFIK